MILFHIKLVGGDELIAQTEPSPDPTKYYLLCPMEVQTVIDDKGKGVVVLQAYAPFTSTTERVELSKHQVISISQIIGEMVEYYKASVEYSGLFIVKDTNESIKYATAHLKLFIENKGETDPLNYLFEEVDEEDIDEETLEQITNANTTIH